MSIFRNIFLKNSSILVTSLHFFKLSARPFLLVYIYDYCLLVCLNMLEERKRDYKLVKRYTSDHTN